MSAGFQTLDFASLDFPAELLIDYIRVYQRKGAKNVGCDPPDYPTMKYIQNHINAYTSACFIFPRSFFGDSESSVLDPNLTTWAQAGYSYPKNMLYAGGTC